MRSRSPPAGAAARSDEPAAEHDADGDRQLKRFYTQVATAGAADGHRVHLDGKPVRTPGRRLLAMPGAALAEAVAGEWRAQGETIDAARMPLTRLATTVVDLMPARREDAIAEAVGYAATDLLCYRAAEPPALVERQTALWQPWLDWASLELDATLLVTDDVTPLDQPAPALRSIELAVRRLDHWRLVGLHAATTLTGSVVLGLAMERGVLDAGAAFTAALLDELFEVERWGEEEIQQRRHAELRRDLEAAGRFLEELPR
jgi:chaperone required for assembly of F1-ATPase